MTDDLKEATNLMEDAIRILTSAYRVVYALKAAERPQPAETFQARVEPWMMDCFGPTIAGDKLERGDRHLEEVLELLQSGDYPRERVAALVDYVYNRPAGEPSQEVGGVMVTLAAYCLAHGLDMHEAAETELARITQPEIVLKIRAKQAAKPTGSALPVAQPVQGDGEPTEAELRCAAWAWRNDKDRETDSGDDLYFRNNWQALPGLRDYVEREIAKRVPGDGEGVTHEAAEGWVGPAKSGGYNTEPSGDGLGAYRVIAATNRHALNLRAGIPDRSREPLLGPPTDMAVSRVLLAERPDVDPKEADRLAVKINDALAAANDLGGRPVPADVARFVVAARIVAFEDQSPDALRELDVAPEAFAARVPWENEPDDLAQPEPSSAAGAWVTVPREPTEAMVCAGDRQEDPGFGSLSARTYRAMLASAPKAEVEGWSEPEAEEDDGEITVRAFHSDKKTAIAFTLYPDHVLITRTVLGAGSTHQRLYTKAATPPPTPDGADKPVEGEGR